MWRFWNVSRLILDACCRRLEADDQLWAMFCLEIDVVTSTSGITFGGVDESDSPRSFSACSLNRRESVGEEEGTQLTKVSPLVAKKN